MGRRALTSRAGAGAPDSGSLLSGVSSRSRGDLGAAAMVWPSPSHALPVFHTPHPSTTATAFPAGHPSNVGSSQTQPRRASVGTSLGRLMGHEDAPLLASQLQLGVTGGGGVFAQQGGPKSSLHPIDVHTTSPRQKVPCTGGSMDTQSPPQHVDGNGDGNDKAQGSSHSSNSRTEGKTASCEVISNLFDSSLGSATTSVPPIKSNLLQSSATEAPSPSLGCQETSSAATIRGDPAQQQPHAVVPRQRFFWAASQTPTRSKFQG